MGEAAAAEGPMQRRIEFHGARNPHTAAVAAAAPGGFRMEMLRTDADKRVAAARSEGGRRFEKGESSGNGFDPELAAARVYLRRIGAGLHNLGNTCYLNSVLQCLTYTEPFVAYLQSGKHKSSCRTTGFCALCALQNHVRSALQSTGKILKPVHFVNNLRCISRSFRNSRQEDAHELMVSLLESMHKCCLPSGIPSESPSAYEKSLVHRIFGGRLRSQVRCTRCSHCSNKYDPFLDLSLEIGNATTLMKALQNFTQEEVLDGGEKQYNCQRCKQKVVAKKRIIIDKAPSVLTIHLKRFSPFNPLLKIDKKVDFHPTLNLKPFVSNSEDMDLKYNLYGVLVHAGWNTQSGHYYCFVRTSSGIWHNLDDNQVHQVREADVLKQKAYMLFYVRDTVRSLGMHKNNSAATLSGKSVIPNMTFGEVKKLYGDMRLQKQSPPDSGQSSMVSNTPQDQCSSERSKSELIAESSQSNGPASVQNASCTHPDGAASLSAKMKHIASDCKSPGQPDTCILRDASCDQKEFEKPLQGLQPEPDDALTDSGKDVPAAVVPTGNGPDELLGATGQTTDSHTLRDANCDQKACEMPLQELQIGHECTDSGKDIPAAAIPICNDTDGLLGVTGQLTEPRTDPYCESSPDTCILRDVSCDQKPCEKTLHELQPEPDDTLTDSVKDIPAAAIPVCNGTGGLFGATGQPTEPQTNPLCRSSPDTDTAAIAQTIPSEDAIVSNGTVSSNEDSTIGNEAKEIEPVKQQDVLVVVEKLSVESIDGEGNAENQTSVQNNRLDDVKVMVNELSVMDTDHMENAERTSVQNNALDIRQVNPERQISSEDSAQAVCSEDCAQVLCSENSVQVSDKDPCHGISHKKKDIKSKKHVRYQAVNLFFGSKQLLLGSLKPGNRRKRKRTKRRYKSSVDIESIANDQQASTSETVLTKGISCKSHRRKRSRNAASSEDGVQLLNKKQNLGDSSGAAELTEDKKDKDALLANDQQASTSETVLTEGISCKSHRRKHSRNTASSEDGVQLLNKKQNLGDSSGAAELTEDKKDKDALLACAELSSLCPSSVSNSDERKCVRANESGSRHFDILTRGLREITVPRWDGIGMPNNNVTELQYSRTTSIGYVLDGWDEEYDRGRRKKARKPTGNFSGPNPFQETANMRSRQRMRPEVELARTGHKPFRI